MMPVIQSKLNEFTAKLYKLIFVSLLFLWFFVFFLFLKIFITFRFLFHFVTILVSGSYEIIFTPSKYIETSEGGLVIISINEGDGGRYDSYLDGTLLCSYSVNVDAHRCTPPSKKNDYQKIYSHWCNEFEKYKSAMKQWQAKQEISILITKD
uniref:Uncharacterized protein n=1 Tax=Glossina palpalis gambiensis TaxID=67801 RepID=A0A1B0BPG5_9MUSC